MSFDWQKTDQLARGTPVTITKETCQLAEILAKEVDGRDNPLMELAVQVATWRETYQQLRQEYNPPEDAGSRKAIGYSDLQRLQEENFKLKNQLAKARYAMLSNAAMMKQAAEVEE